MLYCISPSYFYQQVKTTAPLDLYSPPLPSSLGTPKQFGTQLKVQFMPALAAADAMVLEQQQLLSLSGSRSGGGGGDGSDGGAIVTPIRRATHGIPRKRDGVLLDFGTGTSFASFAELWHYLKTNGWNTAPGKVRTQRFTLFVLQDVL